jgi:hypothetical protein
MSNNDDSESLSQHPLFRALILMGGGLALGCGGVAQTNTQTTESGGAQTGPATSTSTAGSSNATAGNSNATAGNSNATAGSSSSGTIQLGQAGGVSANNGGSSGVPNDDGCPYAQWDCSQLTPACIRDLSQGLAGTGCFCNSARPLTVTDCAANESLFCLQAIGLGSPDTWDYTNHIQCSCAPTPAATDYEAAANTCLDVFPGQTRFNLTAYLPASTTCDSTGTVCTATSADVLRQEGIMCGCADIGLK